MLNSRCGWFIASVLLSGIASVPSAAIAQRSQEQRPNIVLMFPDNLGWGEVGVYGSVRGVPTPQIDRIATEGIRLNNFNVEYSCTVSRIALLTGRYAARTGGTQATGMTLWSTPWWPAGRRWRVGRRAVRASFTDWIGTPLG